MGDNPLLAREEPCGIRQELKLMIWGPALTRAASAKEVKAEVNMILNENADAVGSRPVCLYTSRAYPTLRLCIAYDRNF